jgi:uncharacterized protein (TIGR03086 family)
VSEVSDRYSRVAEGFTRRIESVPEDRWDAVTPCEEWTALDLAKHVVKTHRNIIARLEDREGTPLAEDDDVIAEWHLASKEVSAALDDPKKASTTVGGMFGDQSFEHLVGRLLCADTLIHTWDLARATGQDEALDPGAVEAAHSFLGPIDDKIRNPGGFAPAIEPPAGADAQAKFLYFTGRQP